MPDPVWTVDDHLRGKPAASVALYRRDSERFREYVEGKPELEAELVSYNYRGRVGRPREVAACCVYLLSDDSGFVTGADYIVDGGRTAGS